VTANAPGAGIPVGKVTFLDGSSVLGEVLLDLSGTATFSTGALSVGSHAISMIFAGVPNFAGSTRQLTQLVQAPN
jgi:Bacterial Ig-like domain (group 3)